MRQIIAAALRGPLGWILVVLFAVGGWTHLQRDKGRQAAEQKAWHQTLHAINAHNEQLAGELRLAVKVAGIHRAAADRLRATQDSILKEHPVASAPPVCSPWVTALTKCQQETAELRAANDTLTRSLTSSEEARQRSDSLLNEAPDVFDGCDILGIPCPVIGPGAGFSTEGEFRAGVFGIIPLF